MLKTATYDPNEWQLVPKVPTAEMINCGAPYLTGLTSYAYPTANKVFGAMLAAAPEYPHEHQEPIGEVTESPVHPDAFGIYKHTFHSEERIPLGAELFVLPVDVVSEPLTDEEILSIENGHSGHNVIEFASAIERRVRKGKQ